MKIRPESRRRLLVLSKPAAALAGCRIPVVGSDNYYSIRGRSSAATPLQIDVTPAGGY